MKGAHKRSNLSHAYLLAGTEGVGKFDLAVDFIGLINNVKEKERILDQSNPDIFIIEPGVATHGKKVRKKDISIEQVKEAVGKMSYHAYGLDYKMLLIREAEKMTATAANSLLKLIEEPKEDTKIILIAHQEQKILPTIRSRCQIIRCNPTDSAEIEKYLKEKYADFNNEEVKKSAELSRGRLKLAEKYLQDEKLRVEVEKHQEKLRMALKGGILDGLDLAGSFGNDREKALEALNEWIWQMRDFLVSAINDNQDRKIIKRVNQMTRELVELRSVIKNTNVNQKIQLENFFVQLS